MEKLNIPLFRPSLGEEELESLRAVFKTGWVGLGPKTSELETEIARYQGVQHAVGMNSATAALHLAVECLELPPDSEVLVPTITFVSTPHCVEYNGLKTKFVDSRADDLCMDLDDFQSKISPTTRAVIPVHMGGQPCRMDEICAIAKRHGITVIEDVANAQGGEWKGRKLGSWGEMGALSFEAKKNMTTGDGGMLIFNDSRWLERVKQMRWVGINKDTWKRFADSSSGYSWYYEVDCLGYKYNMNDIAASIGLCQLRKLDDFNARKRRLIRNYLEALKGVGDLWLPSYDLEKGGYWLFIVHTDRRDGLVEFLARRGVVCGVHFMPTHLHPLYLRKYPGTRLPVAERTWKRIVTLPLFPSMSDREQEYVVQGIRDFYAGRAA